MTVRSGGNTGLDGLPGSVELVTSPLCRSRSHGPAGRTRLNGNNGLDGSASWRGLKNDGELQASDNKVIVIASCQCGVPVAKKMCEKCPQKWCSQKSPGSKALGGVEVQKSGGVVQIGCCCGPKSCCPVGYGNPKSRLLDARSTMNGTWRHQR